MKCINEYIEKLKSSKTEDEVLINLKSIIKTFSVDLYIDIVLGNPYFKALLPELKEEVIEEMSILRSSIKDELYDIDKELMKSMKQEDYDKLKYLKIECLHLLKELDNRKDGLDRLI